MLYAWLKLIHILSSTLLFGTGLGSAYYLWRAHLSGNLPAIAFAARAVVLADWLFTTPAVIIQPITGIWMALLVGFALTQPWLLWAMCLYIVVGACWLPVVWLQISVQHMVATALATEQPLPERYYRYMRYWFMLGWPAFIGVMIIFYLMVFKPL